MRELSLDTLNGFTCPLTQRSLYEVSLDEARHTIAAGRPLASRRTGPRPVGETPLVLLRDDAQAAFPVVDGVPVLLAPEILTRDPSQFDLAGSHYAEAYSEIGFYDAAAADLAEQIQRDSLAVSDAESIRWLDRLHKTQTDRAAFPLPRELWLSSRMDLGSEWDCYSHISPAADQSVVQLGGTGTAAIGLLLAGAANASLLTPMLGEARLARALAQAVGVHIRCVIGIAEEIPLPTASADIAYSAGSLHHMTTNKAFPEIARVLRPGGRFAAVEPWRAPLYDVGTRLFGKREANAFCRPLTAERLRPLADAFSSSRIVQHGTLTRYPMLALEKLGARFSLSTAWRVTKFDDFICLPLGLRRFGSGVAVLATK